MFSKTNPLKCIHNIQTEKKGLWIRERWTVGCSIGEEKTQVGGSMWIIRLRTVFDKFPILIKHSNHSLVHYLRPMWQFLHDKITNPKY